MKNDSLGKISPCENYTYYIHNIYIIEIKTRNSHSVLNSTLYIYLFILNFSSQLQIWDTAGQERFRTITQSYYRSANGVVLVYDISTADSFKNLGRWLEDVKKYAGKCLHQMMIGNKCDLHHRREVTEEEAKNFASHYGVGDTLETSAKVYSKVISLTT